MFFQDYFFKINCVFASPKTTSTAFFIYCFSFSGVKNIDNCPAGYTIPIFLIVTGIMFLVLVPFPAAIIICLKYTSFDNQFGQCFRLIPRLLFNCAPIFWLMWLLSGFVWVFRIYKPDYDILSVTYCDELTYKTSLAVITVTYIFSLFGCCICCFQKKLSYEPLNNKPNLLENI